jgi:hypothetical protein
MTEINMQNDRPEDSFGSEFKMRVPGDFMPRLHAHARSKGLTSSAYVRMLVIAEMDQAGRDDRREAA